MEKTLDAVRQEIWVYTLENNTILPARECLQLRAKNLAFQLRIWSQATLAILDVPDPLEYGWEKSDTGYSLIPDSKENVEKRDTVYRTIMKKCRCKKSGCKNGRCVCFNAKMSCSSFCECLDCCNPYSDDTSKDNDDSEGEGSISDELSEDSESPSEESDQGKT